MKLSFLRREKLYKINLHKTLLNIEYCCKLYANLAIYQLKKITLVSQQQSLARLCTVYEYKGVWWHSNYPCVQQIAFEIGMYLKYQYQVGWSDFFIGQQLALKKGQVWFISKFSFQKIPGGLNINIFFVKIGIKLPFTLKHKCKLFCVGIFVLKTILFTLEKHVFGFWSKPPKKIFFRFWLWFSFKNKRRTNVL